MKYVTQKFLENGKPKVFLDGRNKQSGPWYVAVLTDSGREFGYLLEDGRVNGSCMDDNDNALGWYNTREAARKAVRIRKALDKQQTVS